MVKVTGFFAACVLMLGFSPVWAESRSLITVTGEGRVMAVPDMAEITMGASADAETAQDAVRRTSDITAAILDRLTAESVAPRDIRTSDLSLSPLWSHRADSEGRPQIEGYQASNSVTIRVRDLDALGRILDAVLSDGANQLGGLRFAIADPEPLLNEARVKAVADARARAALLAEAAGVGLGPLVSLSEVGASLPRPEMMSMARIADAGVPIAEGEAELSARVTLVYEIAIP